MVELANSTTRYVLRACPCGGPSAFRGSGSVRSFATRAAQRGRSARLQHGIEPLQGQTERCRDSRLIVADFYDRKVSFSVIKSAPGRVDLFKEHAGAAFLVRAPVSRHRT
jgi:hypothetical protein